MECPVTPGNEKNCIDVRVKQAFGEHVQHAHRTISTTDGCHAAILISWVSLSTTIYVSNQAMSGSAPTILRTLSRLGPR